MMRLENQTILITGGGSGIGLELARRLVARKNQVIITGRDQAKLDRATRETPALRAIASDVGDPRAIEDLRARVSAEFADLSVLINNAGVMRRLDLNQSPAPDDVSREIEIDLIGPIRLTQALLPLLRTRPAAAVVNVTSALAFAPLPIAPVYSAAKAGLRAFTRSLRVQMAGTPVRVIELAPPAVETPLFDGEFSNDDLGGFAKMDPAKLVDAFIAGVEAGRVEIRPGMSNLVKVMSRVAPETLLSRMS